MLIAISKYTQSLAEVDIHRAAHQQYLATLFAEKKLLVSGRQTPPIGGVIIANTNCLEEFKAILANDPFVKAGVTEYTITEFIPSFCDDSLKFMVS